MTTLTAKSILETREVGTAFKNKTWVYQGIFDQQKKGKLSGRFGVWGSHRDFEASGEEALAPPTKQNAFAVFALETLDFEKASVQFGGRRGNKPVPAQLRRPRAAFCRIGPLPDFPAPLASGFRPGKVARSSPTTRIHIELRLLKSSTTKGHIRVIWRSRSAIPISLGSRVTRSISVFATLRSDFVLKPMASTTASAISFFWPRPAN